MKRSVRNIIIFAVVAMGGGFLGHALDLLNPPKDPMQGLGALLWLLSPLLANLLLRSLGKDGWKDFGIRLHLRESWVWYLAALLVVPVIVAVILGIGAAVKVISFAGFAEKGFTAILPLLGSAFAASMVKNIFEEFSWRGYLTPRFEALKLHPFVNSLLTGIIWAAWHIPYYLYFLDPEVLHKQTFLSIPALIFLALLSLPFQALAYGELRLLSKSVWPAWLLHTVANAVSFALISYGFVTVKAGFLGVLLSPGTEGIFHSLLMGGIGLLLYWTRLKRSIEISK